MIAPHTVLASCFLICPPTFSFPDVPSYLTVSPLVPEDVGDVRIQAEDPNHKWCRHQDKGPGHTPH